MKERKNYLEALIDEFGTDSIANRLSIYIGDILKAAPANTEINDAVMFLLSLRTDILRNKENR